MKTKPKTTPDFEIAIKHVLVWSAQSSTSWVELLNPLVLHTRDWDEAAHSARKIVGRRMPILALVADGADKEKARRFVVGG